MNEALCKGCELAQELLRRSINGAEPEHFLDASLALLLGETALPQWREALERVKAELEQETFPEPKETWPALKEKG